MMLRLFAAYSARLGRPADEVDISGHLPELHAWARGYRQVRVLELGVKAGNSTAAFLAAIELERGGWLWSIDLQQPTSGEAREWLADADALHWRFLQADDMSVEAVEWAPRQVDVLFIDTSHTHEHTLAELRVYGPRVAAGGVILLHDTDLESGATWLPDAPGGERMFGVAGPSDPKFPVRMAIQQWCHERRLTWEEREGYFGLGVIRIPR